MNISGKRSRRGQARLSLKKRMRERVYFTRSARRVLAVARHLVACYLSSRAGLKQLGKLNERCRGVC